MCWNSVPTLAKLAGHQSSTLVKENQSPGEAGDGQMATFGSVIGGSERRLNCQRPESQTKLCVTGGCYWEV